MKEHRRIGRQRRQVHEDQAERAPQLVGVTGNNVAALNDVGGQRTSSMRLHCGCECGRIGVKVTFSQVKDNRSQRPTCKASAWAS